MKITAFVVAVALASVLVYAENTDVKLRVTVTLTNGTTEEYKLDWIDENKIVVFERGTLEPREFRRNDVLSLGFGDDFGNKFREGEEGFVLKDKSVLYGHPTGMDTTTFWIIPRNSKKEEKIAREEVLYIQFTKSAQKSASPKPVAGESGELVLVVANGWEDSEVDVAEGQQIWFTISDLESYSCGPEAPRVNANGKEPFERDSRRPMPDVNHCALIAKIGKGQPFRVGLTRTPFTASQNGRIFLTVNDYNYNDNVGRLSVYIKTGDRN